MLPKAYDELCTALLTLAFCFFCVEVTNQLAGRRNYAANLFFWLDVAATLSLIPEVPVLRDIGTSDTGGLALARAGRAARAGARAGRLSGLIKIVRLFKVTQLVSLPFFYFPRECWVLGLERIAAVSLCLAFHILPSFLTSCCLSVFSSSRPASRRSHRARRHSRSPRRTRSYRPCCRSAVQL